jgi:hypothetical protein
MTCVEPPDPWGKESRNKPGTMVAIAIDNELKIVVIFNAVMFAIPWLVRLSFHGDPFSLISDFDAYCMRINCHISLFLGG